MKFYILTIIILFSSVVFVLAQSNTEQQKIIKEGDRINRNLKFPNGNIISVPGGGYDVSPNGLKAAIYPFPQFPDSLSNLKIYDVNGQETIYRVMDFGSGVAISDDGRFVIYGMTDWESPEPKFRISFFFPNGIEKGNFQKLVGNPRAKFLNNDSILLVYYSGGELIGKNNHKYSYILKTYGINFDLLGEYKIKDINDMTVLEETYFENDLIKVNLKDYELKKIFTHVFSKDCKLINIIENGYK